MRHSSLPQEEIYYQKRLKMAPLTEKNNDALMSSFAIFLKSYQTLEVGPEFLRLLLESNLYKYRDIHSSESFTVQ